MPGAQNRLAIEGNGMGEVVVVQTWQWEVLLALLEVIAVAEAALLWH